MRCPVLKIITENCSLPAENIMPRISMIRKLARTLGRKITFKVYMDSMQLGASARSQLFSSGAELVDCPHDGMKEVVDKAITGVCGL